MRSFSDELAHRIRERNSALCVGLDPRKTELPQGMLPDAWQDEPDAVAQAFKFFCFGVLDVVAPLVPVVKPQMAFFEQLGPAGMRVLKQIVDYARTKDVLVILDGKRNDIGSTAEAYAQAYLGRRSAWGADALTVNPYLGRDALQPFVKYAFQQQAGIFVLVKTSNPGSTDLQDRVSDGGPLYQTVAQHVEEWAAETESDCGYGAVGAVVGATFPEQLAELRAMMPHAWLLVPGLGAQGATPSDVAHAFDSKRSGAIINASRSIIFAHRSPEYERFAQEGNWQGAVEAATRNTIAALNQA